MMDTEIKALLWDYGNVLVGWSPRQFYQTIIHDVARLDYFLENVCSMEWHTLNDAGIGMAENIARRQKEFPEFSREIAMWQSNFGDTLAGEIVSSVTILKQVHAQGLPQYCLTNMAEEVEDVCFNPFNLRQYFKDIIVSGAEKCVKPDAKIYEIALSRMGLEANQVFFTDDNPANIAAAANMGFKTHLFKNDGGLEIALKEIGILK